MVNIWIKDELLDIGWTVIQQDLKGFVLSDSGRYSVNANDIVAIESLTNSTYKKQNSELYFFEYKVDIL